jgi:hypothetical protein
MPLPIIIAAAGSLIKPNLLGTIGAKLSGRKHVSVSFNDPVTGALVHVDTEADKTAFLLWARGDRKGPWQNYRGKTSNPTIPQPGMALAKKGGVFAIVLIAGAIFIAWRLGKS